MSTRRKFLVPTIYAMLAMSRPSFGNDTLAVEAFKKFVDMAVQETSSAQEPYLFVRRNLWAKRRYVLSEVKYDVKRTDSLVNPILGLIIFTVVVTQTSLFSTKEEAAENFFFDPKLGDTYQVRLNFIFAAGIWSLKDGDYESKFHGKPRFEVTPGKIEAEPTAQSFAPLIFWLKSR